MILGSVCMVIEYLKRDFFGRGFCYIGKDGVFWIMLEDYEILDV